MRDLGTRFAFFTLLKEPADSDLCRHREVPWRSISLLGLQIPPLARDPTAPTRCPDRGLALVPNDLGVAGNADVTAVLR